MQPGALPCKFKSEDRWWLWRGVQTEGRCGLRGPSCSRKPPPAASRGLREPKKQLVSGAGLGLEDGR